MSPSILTWTDFLLTSFLLLCLLWSNIFQLLEKPKLSFTFKTFFILHLCIGQFFHHLHKANSFSSSRTCLKTSIQQRSLPGPLNKGICSYGIMQSFLTLYCNCVSRTRAPWHHCFLRLGAVSTWSPAHLLVANIQQHLKNIC